MHIISSALKEVDFLIVGVGSAECSHTPDDPFTAGERIEMLIRASEEYSLSGRLIPIPVRDINRHAVWVAHIVSLVPEFSVVYSNNPLTESLFRDTGYEVRSPALVDRTHLSGINVRKAISEGGKWRDLVPSSVAEYLDTIEAARRIKGE
jgi:nicotinamide-nucleotide adenylyltransferase